MNDPVITLLLVEDDEDDYILTREILDLIEGNRYRLDWAPTYKDGLIKLTQGGYDLALIDYDLGAGTGLELVRAVNAAEMPVPVILLTGRGNYEVDIEAMQAGVLEYLNKSELSPMLMERSIRYSIERKQNEIKFRQAAARSNLLADIAQDFVDLDLNIEDLLQSITQRIGEHFGAASIIRVLSSEEKYLRSAAAFHPDPEAYRHLLQIMPKMFSIDDRNIVARAARERKIQRLTEKMPAKLAAELMPAYIPWLERYSIKNLIIVPMFVKKRLVGTLSIFQSPQKKGFSREEEAFYRELAARIALAIENAQLYQKEAYQAQQMRALNTAISTLLDTLNPQKLIGIILRAGRDALPKAKKVSLFLYEGTPDHLSEYMLRENGGTRLVKVRVKTETPAKVAAGDTQPIRVGKQDTRDSFLARTVNEQRQLYAAKSKPSTGLTIYLDLPGQDSDYSVLFSPLVTDEVYFGALIIETDQLTHFRREDFEVFESFSTTVTAALNNAHLHAHVLKLAVTDNLTGLFNRRGFFELGEREMNRFHRLQRPLSVIMMDIDNFKSINDTYGHSAGDRILKDFASSCANSVRKVDIVARFGGDEFIILLPETDVHKASRIAERIRACFAKQQYPLPDGTRSFSASFGVSQASEPVKELMEIIAQADKALYQSKQKGRNQVEIG